MFAIGEFARLGGVTTRTLRYYEQVGLVRPAQVDDDTGYRRYSVTQLGTLNRVLALKDLGFSLDQIRTLIGGVTIEQLRGMLLLRRAQLERELDDTEDRLSTVEARLRHIERENAMPADDVVVKRIPATPVVAVGAPAAGFGPTNLGPVIHALELQFEALGLRRIVGSTEPYVTFYTGDPERGTLVANVAVPVHDAHRELPEPAHHQVLPPVEAAVAVRAGAGVFPYVYQDLARWIDDHGHRLGAHGREVWLTTAADAGGIEGQVIEVQLPFLREQR